MAGSVENLFNDRDTVVVVEAENVASDLDQERVEDTSVPLGKDFGNLLFVETETALENVVGLGNELHVSVLDTVVDHLDVVAGTGLADPVAAGLALGLSSGLFCSSASLHSFLLRVEIDIRKISLMWGQAASEPPGINEGPFLAPSSPPETPEPTKSNPLASSSLVRRIESG